eukprot:764472-Hanusia_phi.AAC.9
MLGLAVEEEVVEEETGFSIDLYFPALSLFVEVDGPFHYAVNLAREEEDDESRRGVSKSEWLKERERRLPLGEGRDGGGGRREGEEQREAQREEGKEQREGRRHI